MKCIAMDNGIDMISKVIVGRNLKQHWAGYQNHAENLRKKQKRLRTKRRLILNKPFLQKSDVFMCEKEQFFEEIFCVPTFCLVFSSFFGRTKKNANYTVNSLSLCSTIQQIVVFVL